MFHEKKFFGKNSQKKKKKKKKLEYFYKKISWAVNSSKSYHYGQKFCKELWGKKILPNQQETEIASLTAPLSVLQPNHLFTCKQRQTKVNNVNKILKSTQ